MQYFKICKKEHEELNVLRGMQAVLSTGLVTGLLMEISLYSDELFDILQKYFKWVVNVGFDRDNKVRQNTNHLNNPIHYDTIDQCRRHCRTLRHQFNIDSNNESVISPENNQRMYLFTNFHPSPVLSGTAMSPTE